MKTAPIIFLLAFGAITLFVSSSVLFDLFGIREKEGNFVPLIVWANWLCGFLYVAAAVGLSKAEKYSTYLLAGALIVLLAAFGYLLFHIAAGGLYETKTVAAMLFRIGVTGLFLFLSFRFLPKR